MLHFESVGLWTWCGTVEPYQQSIHIHYTFNNRLFLSTSLSPFAYFGAPPLRWNGCNNSCLSQWKFFQRKKVTLADFRLDLWESNIAGWEVHKLCRGNTIGIWVVDLSLVWCYRLMGSRHTVVYIPGGSIFAILSLRIYLAFSGALHNVLDSQRGARLLQLTWWSDLFWNMRSLSKDDYKLDLYAIHFSGLIWPQS